MTENKENTINMLSENINQMVRLTNDEKSCIENAFKSVRVTKDDLWVKEGEVCEQIAFVETGKLRVYYNEDTGNEVTCYFATPNNFISSYTSFLTNTPTTENIAALENSSLRSISKSGLEKLSEDIPKIHIWRRIVAENLFIYMEKRILMLQSQKAHERYEKLLKENPDILLNIPLKYTASFLGITPQHLSRLRKESLQ